MESKFFYINVGCGQQRNLTNHSSFPMIKASQNKGVSYEENLETIHSIIGDVICFTRM